MMNRTNRTRPGNRGAALALLLGLGCLHHQAGAQGPVPPLPPPDALPAPIPDGEAFDPAANPVGYESHYATPQKATPQAAPPTPPPPQAPPQTPPPSFSPPQPPPSYVPMLAPTPSSPTSFVQVPGPNLVLQQGAPQVYMAQPIPTTAMVPQQAAPSFGNMFLAAPAPAPTAMMAPMMAVAAPMAAPAPAPSPAPVASAAVTNQTVSLAASGRTRVRVRGPGLIRSSLARLGERLVRLGNVRIETIQETRLDAPIAQGGPGIATFSTTSAPLPAPTMQFSAPPPARHAPPHHKAPPQAAPPTYQPVPSPQEAPPKHGGLFDKFRP